MMSIKCNGQEITIPYCICLGQHLALGFGYIINPPVGESQIEVGLTENASMLTEAVSFTGVHQTDAVWRIRDGVGKMVVDLPIDTWVKVNTMTLGIGAVDDTDAGLDRTYGSQILQWDVSSDRLRMNGVSAIGDADEDQIPLPNKLTKASDWAIMIVGINPS